MLGDHDHIAAEICPLDTLRSIKSITAKTYRTHEKRPLAGSVTYATHKSPDFFEDIPLQNDFWQGVAQV